MTLTQVEDPRPAPAHSRTRPLILVVDDQPTNIQVLYALLKEDYDICMALDAKAALALCTERQPDLILLDVIMPGMDGYCLCRHLKAGQLTRDIPVIFVTGSLEREQEVRGFEAGAVDFITKPFHASIVVARVRTQITLKTQSDQLRALSNTDGLTGIANRRRFDTVLHSEIQRIARTAEPLTVLLIDVDYFKRFNDHYGHPEGDQCLHRIGQCIANCLGRPHDLAARYGGEEFACILPETPLTGAVKIAVSIEQAVRSLGIAHAVSDHAQVVTVSIGVAQVDQRGERDPELVLRAADRQLYLAKAAGRGCISA